MSSFVAKVRNFDHFDLDCVDEIVGFVKLLIHAIPTLLLFIMV